MIIRTYFPGFIEISLSPTTFKSNRLRIQLPVQSRRAWWGEGLENGSAGGVPLTVSNSLPPIFSMKCVFVHVHYVHMFYTVHSIDQ